MMEIEETKATLTLCMICKDSNNSKRFIMLAFFISHFLVWCLYSVLGSFFPLEANAKNVANSITGLIMGIFELVIVIIAPLFGYFTNKIGAKILFVGGVFLCGSSSVVFGTLSTIANADLFIGMCFFIRILAAIGAAAFTTSSYAILASNFPNSIATVFGSLEISTGLGLMIGPPLGGALYEAGGFFLPFAILGSTLFCFGIICIFFLPTQQVSKFSKESVNLSLFKLPVVIIIILCQISASICLGFTNATLSLFLSKTFNLTPLFIGLVFLSAPITYCAMCPMWGFLADKYKNYNFHFIATGFLIGGFFYFFIGPAPFFNFKPTIWLTVLCLSAGGFGISTISLSFKCVSDACQANGYAEDIGTFGIVATIVISSFAIGAFIGPFLGGYLYDKIGFEWTSVIVGTCAISCAIMVISYILIKRFSLCCNAKDDEKMHLLDTKLSEVDKAPLDKIDAALELPNTGLEVKNTDIDVKNNDLDESNGAK